jgi:hypothetical protein
MLRKLEVAAIINQCLPPHPDNVLSGGTGVEALVLAMRDGHHALDKVGQRLQKRGMLPLHQEGLEAQSLTDYRFGQMLDALVAANRNGVFSALARNALAVYAIPTPWMHHDTTTLALYGAYDRGEEQAGPESKDRERPGPPQPAYGQSKAGRTDRKQVLRSLGGSGDGGLPLRVGLRDGNTSESLETAVAIEEGLKLGLEGVIGMVADSKAYSRRTGGLCLEKQIGLVTLVPRTCERRQEWEGWGQAQAALPLLREKPGRTRGDEPERWHGQSGRRQGEVEYAHGQVAVEEIRCVGVHASPLAQREAKRRAKAHAQAEGKVAAHRKKGEARSFACVADAEAAIGEDAGRGAGRRGRRPQLWHYHALSYRVEAFRHRKKRAGKGRPRRGEPPEAETRYRLRVEVQARERGEEANGWTVLATTVDSAVCSDVEMLDASLAPGTTVEPGFRWIKNPAVLTPVWLEKPERIAA